MNKVILTGNLARNVELKQTANGTSYTNNAIAVRNDFKNKETGTYDSQFYEITVFGTSAEYMSRYCQKGSKVLITGRLDRDTYEKDGVKRDTYKIIVDGVESFKTDTTQRVNTKQEIKEQADLKMNEISDDDLPF